MHVQITSLFNHINGSTRQALMLAKAFATIPFCRVKLVSVIAGIHSKVEKFIADTGIELFEVVPAAIPDDSEINIVIGLWDEATIEAAIRLSFCKGRLILAPTTYRYEPTLSKANRHI